MRAGLSGDQKCEGLFKCLAAYVPKAISFHHPVDLELWIRVGQWRLMLGNADPWSQFCKAMGAYPERLAKAMNETGRGKIMEYDQGGWMFHDVVKYIHGINGHKRKRCPGQKPTRGTRLDAAFHEVDETYRAYDDLQRIRAVNTGGDE